MNKNQEFLLQHAMQHERLLRLCLGRFTRNAADVEDLLYETYERLMTTSSTGPVEVGAIRSYVVRAASNVALDWLRRERVVPLELIADMAELNTLDEDTLVDEIVNSEQELALLRAAIARLPRRARQVFTLRKVYDLSQKEIAVRLGISENTVEQLLRKAAHRCVALVSRQAGSTGMTARQRRHGATR